MIKQSTKKLKSVLAMGLLISAVSLPNAHAQKIPDQVVEAIKFREIGPTRQGGRYVEFAVVANSTKVIYAATASGGLWKSVNNGQSWTPIFDNESVISIGSVAVDQKNPDVVWVGSGEANNSRSSYWGDGIYKSTDAGKTWTNMGLPESHHIGRIVIDPTDSDVVYVAALGHLYSENEERGLYKTTNGGKTWKKVLDIQREDGKYIGVVDVIMSPEDPNTLIAAAYDKIRRPWTFNEGGEGSAVYKSTDGGKSWNKLSNGFPGGFLGRIGLAYAPNNANVVYANVENVNVEGISEEERKRMLEIGLPLGNDQKTAGTEMYRSDDGGESWRKISPEGEDVGGYPSYYYQQVIVDPNDEDHVYVLGIRVWETKDGGKTWGMPFRFGGDNHAMWIDPADSEHMLLGYDHGMGITYDAGATWYHPDELPLAQFYAVDVDMAYPYNVYGGLQDNGSVRGPSSMKDGSSIPFEAWQRVGGGDGMYNVIDRSNNRYLYNESQFGPIQRLDLETGESKSIRYSGAREMRWNWNSPIVVSQHDTDVIYHAGNKVLRSSFRGENWTEISPDLSKNDSIKALGTGNIQYGTITTLEESPLDPNELWAGTDDGNVQVTRDGGKTWTLLNENIPNNPEYWVTRIEASAHYPGTAYLSYNGMRRDDFSSFLYKTTDWGETWTSIAAGIPAGGINVIREDSKNPDLLFVGTELGTYASIDGGANWTRFMTNMPSNPAYDMVIHPRENELVVATHGRGIFIADISPLQGLDQTVLDTELTLFDIQPAVQYIEGLSNVTAYTNFDGESRSPGNHIQFYAKNAGQATIKIYKGAKEIFTKSMDAKAGLNKFVWEFEEVTGERTQKQLDQTAERFRGFGMEEEDIQRRIESMRFITRTVNPGTYTVEVEMNGQSSTKEAVVMKDYWTLN
ncbi:WD40/YVTN/BNR-like repeat-containing protein [Algoriphagus halophilus]|uniref:Sortilin, neurotensin receptor 3 n=1 Tax=Algoriphagus halophilus TaxID=226505 RepID=A0A1N6EAI1_9BACT|nr:glycosyl hydrolase [Algoriphagus halophilus]SIN79971.1 Sortilin, neurotensin receptor 3 [Algoriphagus halophilus]